MKKIIKKIIKKTMSYVIIFSVFLLCASCGTTNSTEQQAVEDDVISEENILNEEPVTLNITMDQGSSNGLVALADAFMAENPNVTINIYYLSWENVANSVAMGSTEDPVDGFMLSFREEMWTEKFLSVWQEKCEDFAQTDLVDLSIFNEGALDAVTTGENVYALPMATSTIGLITNTDLLEECGIEDNPQTIDELLEDCEIIAEHGYTPFQCTPVSLTYMVTAITNYELQADGKAQEYVDTALNGTDAAIGEYYRDAIELVCNLIQKGYLDFNAEVYNPELNEDAGGTEVISSYKDECYAFLNGDVAFYPIYSDLMSSLQKREIKSQAYLDDPFQYEMIPVPTAYGPSALQTASYSLYVCKDSENYDWMNEFVKFVFADSDVSDIGNLSYFTDNQYTMSSVDQSDHATDISKQYYGDFLDLYDTAELCPVDYEAILEYHGYGICTGPMLNMFRDKDKDIASMSADELVDLINVYMKDWFVDGNIQE